MRKFMEKSKVLHCRKKQNVSKLMAIALLAMLLISSTTGCSSTKPTISPTPTASPATTSNSAFNIALKERDSTNCSYIRCDYYIGDEQYGYLYTCPNKDTPDLYEVSFSPDDFNAGEDVDLSLFRLDVYLSYSEYQGEEAVNQAMMGNTGEEVYLGRVSLNATYGQSYEYEITKLQDGNYVIKDQQ